MYKVPFRQVYCSTLKDWLKETFWCHVVIKVFPHAKDFASDGLISLYVDDPEMFYDQHEWQILELNGRPRKLVIE